MKNEIEFSKRRLFGGSFCAKLLSVDWQQPIALAVVIATAATVLWRLFRPARFRLNKSLPCGCAGAGSGIRPPGLLVHSRRGERPTVSMKH